MDQERRDYFRINLNAVIDYQCISKEQLHSKDLYTLFDDGHLIKVHAELAQLEHESTRLLQQVKDKDHILGEYLHVLNRKVCILADQVMANQATDTNSEHRISLSEVGLRFYSKNALVLGQHIALYLHFNKNSSVTLVCAEVARCEPDRDNGYQIAAKFHYSNGTQRQQINQQIMRAQLADKRNNR